MNDLGAARPGRTSVRWPKYLCGLLVTAVCTVAILPAAMHIDLINIVMMYLLGSAVAGLWLGGGPAALTAVANVLALDFFFVPPRFSLMVYDASYLLTFSVFLLVSLLISSLVVAIRRKTEAAAARERHVAALFAMTHDLAATRDAQSMAEITVRQISAQLPLRALILRCDHGGQIESKPVASSACAPRSDWRVAQSVAEKHLRTGRQAPQLWTVPTLYLPLVGSHAAIGVLVVEQEAGGSLSPPQQRLLDGFAAQLASAMERARLTESAQAAHVAAESAQLRNTLLASISHDLRAPLSVIASAGGIVAQRKFDLDVFRRIALGRLIEDKARSMSDLLSSVLDLVRLESGVGVLNREWHILGDLIGTAIQRNDSRLAGWQIYVDVPDSLPMVSVDAALLVQLLSNLLDNAAKYTPPGTRIDISAVANEPTVRIVIEDSGPGLGTQDPELLFEKFARGRSESSAGGAGLGLSICRAIARLHGGEIRATTSRLGGARFEISMSAAAAPATMEEARLEAVAAGA